MANRCVLLLLTVCCIPVRAADAPWQLSPERIKADVAYLASDRLEGRGPGTRGEELTTEYLADEFKKAGLKPMGQRNTYLQPVPLVRVITGEQSTLRAIKGAKTLSLACEEEFSGTSQTQTGLESFDAESVLGGDEAEGDGRRPGDAGLPEREPAEADDGDRGTREEQDAPNVRSLAVRMEYAREAEQTECQSGRWRGA